MRRLFVCVMLLAVGCRAQSPASGPATKGADLTRNTELTQSIAKQVRATFSLPPYVDIEVGERQAAPDFAGYDRLTVKLSYGGQTQTRDLLLSKDGKTLVSVVKMDLTRDPLAEAMAKIDLTGRPVRGNKDAKVTVVVYDDFQCPYCSRMHLVLSDLMKSYGDRVKVVYKDFPLMEIHPWAERAAIDSGCLAKQSGAAYWDFADYVHANGKQIQGDQRAVAAQLNEVDRITVDAGRRHSADLAALDGCIKAQNKSDLKASMKEAEGLGVEATPVMFVDGMKIDGAVPAEEVKLVLDKELRNVGDSAPAGVVAAPPGN